MNPSRLFWFVRATLIVAVAIGVTPRGGLAAEGAAKVHVILWFDTEDYLLPASDDAALRLATLLTERKIQATFKVVGEKARVLEKRGRRDVIDALRKHAVAYHSNLHSVHPTTAEYLADCGLVDGVAEFVRREGPGAADVRRIFGVDRLACYGQPGSAWSAQSIIALPQIGVAPCYVDSGNHVGLNGKPFWYANGLLSYNMRPNETRMELHDRAALGPAKKEVADIAARIRGEGGGVLSIFYHPCEWVHAEFWDGVNFARGQNPPREQWKAPRQLPPGETEQAFAQFEAYVDHIRALPAVDFITASDLPQFYVDRARTVGASKSDLLELARRLADDASTGINYQVIEGKSFSPADQFDLLARSTAALLDGKEVAYPLAAGGILGPDAQAPRPAEARGAVAWPALAATARDAADYVTREKRVPARVFIGADALPPADFLPALAAVYVHCTQNGVTKVEEGVRLNSGTAILTERHVAKESPRLYGDWIIHKENWQPARLMEIAQLQAWTLKPAILAQR